MPSRSRRVFARSTRRIELLIKRKPGGGFSEWVFDRGHADVELKVFGPLGRATFSPTASRHLLVIAGGSGIAGMMSILDRAMQEGYFLRHRGHVFFGVRTWQDRFYLDDFARMKAAFPDNMSVTIALSDGLWKRAFGGDAKVVGREVRLIFVASDTRKANALADNMIEQLKAGSINITMMGKPTSVVEE